MATPGFEDVRGGTIGKAMFQPEGAAGLRGGKEPKEINIQESTRQG